MEPLTGLSWDGDIGTGVASIYRTVLALAAAFACGPATFAQAADGFDQRHKELLGRDDLQFAFPEPEAVEIPREEGNALGWLGDFLNAISPVFTWIFWIALVAAACGLAWFLGRELHAARFGREKKAGEDTARQATSYRPEPARAKALLAEADRLAALGQYDEAARTLLHRSIEDIEERSPQSIHKAQTAREIARLPILPEPVRVAFAPIIRAVEQSWFGGRRLDAEGYRVCRTAYADFALAEAWT